MCVVVSCSAVSINFREQFTYMYVRYLLLLYEYVYVYFECWDLSGEYKNQTCSSQSENENQTEIHELTVLGSINSIMYYLRHTVLRKYESLV